MASYPIDWVDRQWLGMWTAGVLGPVAVPSVDDLRHAFVELAAFGAQTRLGFTVASDRRRWQFDPHRLAELAEQCVVDDGADDFPADIGESEVLARIDELAGGSATLDRHPSQFVRSGSLLSYRKNHAVGDAQAMLNLSSGLVHVAATGNMPKWVTEELDPHPLWSAFSHTFGAENHSLAAALKDRFTHKDKPAPSSQPGPQVEWSPRPASVTTLFSKGSWREVKDWRKVHAPDASMASIYLVMMRRALRAVGVPLSEQSKVLYDCRRHLPRGSHARGNFVIAFSQAIADDVNVAAEQIARTASSGRVLITFAGSAVRYLGHRELVMPTVAPQSPVFDVTFVFAPRGREIEVLPWTRPDLRAYGALSSTSTPTELVLTMMILSGRLAATWSFQGNVLDEELVRQANALMEEQPVALLGG